MCRDQISSRGVSCNCPAIVANDSIILHVSPIVACYPENVAVAAATATAPTSTVVAAAAELIRIVQIYAAGEQAVAAVVT